MHIKQWDPIHIAQTEKCSLIDINTWKTLPQAISFRANVWSLTILIQTMTEYMQKMIENTDKTTLTIDKLYFNQEKHRQIECLET